MREYVYLWNEPQKGFLVISGVEFKDFLSILGDKKSYIFLDHDCDFAKEDETSGFDYVDSSEISKLKEENIYNWGNFVWVDFELEEIPKLSDENISELLFFKHTSRPLKNCTIDLLNNKFLAYAHDDGWFLKLYYSSWNEVSKIVQYINFYFDIIININELRDSEVAYWIINGNIEKIEKTFDINSIQRKYMKHKVIKKKNKFWNKFIKSKIEDV